MGIFGEKIDEYEVLEHLGKGGFAHVYRARCLKSGTMVAIKMIDKDLMSRAGMVSRVRQEVTIHSRLKHPAILELYTFFEDADYVYLVLELAHNGELAKHFRLGTRGLSEQAAADIFKQVVKGVCYLHSHNILHRDLSLNNLLLTKDMRVKIADFGLATQLNGPDEKHVTMCGTPNYISPEVASRDYHGLPADVWGLGCMLYTLLVGQPPFHTQHVKSTLTKVINADFKVPEELSEPAKDILLRLLCRDPSKRISLQLILEHQFLNSRPEVCSGKSEFSKDSGFNTTMQSNQTVKKKVESLHNFTGIQSSFDIQRPASVNVLFGLREASMNSRKNVHRISDKQKGDQTSLGSDKLVDIVNLMNIGSNKENSTSSSNCHIGVPPLCSVRLPNVSHGTRNALLTIHNEFVAVEFIKKRGKDREEKITDICKISNDGMKIVICSLNGGKGIPVSERSKTINDITVNGGETFTYHNLPQKHWKKYLYAARFVDLVKAKTPKITIYTFQVKFQLMENGNDAEAFFYSGEKATSSGNCVHIIDCNGIQHQNPSSSANLHSLFQHFNETLYKCRKIESALTSLGEECFPLTIGKRPILSNAKCKMTTTPTTNACKTPEINLGSFHYEGLSSRGNSECNFSEKKDLADRQIRERRLPLQTLQLESGNNFRNYK